MKRLFRWILFQLWKLQFKKAPIDFKVTGYHCRECAGGKELECGDFPCPYAPNEKLITRFVFPKYNKVLNQFNNKLL